METPEVGHELFSLGVLTDKVPQFHLLAKGNPKPDSVLISPLYQITVGQMNAAQKKSGVASELAGGGD
jgi:hypothetical protein